MPTTRRPRLLKDAAREARRLRAASCSPKGRSQTEVARQFGVSRRVVMFSTPPGTKAVRMSIAGPDACRACVLLRVIRPWCNSLLSMRFNSGEVPCCHPVAPDTLDPGHLLGNQVEPGQLPAPPVGKRPGGC
jgi:hypothetical protein